jgi:hypothetical protein
VGKVQLPLKGKRKKEEEKKKKTSPKHSVHTDSFLVQLLHITKTLVASLLKD